jgi:hypothetical protein
MRFNKNYNEKIKMLEQIYKIGFEPIEEEISSEDEIY